MSGFTQIYINSFSLYRPLPPYIGFILKQPFSLPQPTWEPGTSRPPSLAMPREGALPPGVSLLFLGNLIGPTWIPGPSLNQSLWPRGQEL